MKYKMITKLLAPTVILLIVLSNIAPFAGAISGKKDVENISELPESHFIEGVPYVGQTGPYCYYASCTMIYKYYGINTNESEVLFTTGAGHSLAYPCTGPDAMKNSAWTRYPVAGYALSQESDFICSLYNLSFHEWKPDSNKLSETKIWDQYWLMVKENISNNVPVITCPAPTGLISSIRVIKNSINIPDKLLDFILTLFSGGGHAIVVVGYNETNQSVCFNDPASALVGHPEYGTHAWMSLKNFSKLMKFYSIRTFKKTSSDPLNKTNIFEQAHQRNIQRMNGNASAYGTCIFYGDTAEKFNGILGINALKKFKEDLEPGFKHRFLTFCQYKKNGIKRHRLTTLFELLIPKSFPKEGWETIIDSKVNDRQFKEIIKDKQRVSQVLWNYSCISPVILEEAKLFDQEIENWTKLQECYSKFAKRGIFITILGGFQTIKKMSEILDNIIEIEQKIIDNAT